jgi:hypothetical protein
MAGRIPEQVRKQLREAGGIAENGIFELKMSFDAAIRIGGGRFRHNLVEHGPVAVVALDSEIPPPSGPGPNQ